MEKEEEKRRKNEGSRREKCASFDKDIEKNLNENETR